MNIQRFFKNHKPNLYGLEILKYIGPGFLVTVGFIDPVIGLQMSQQALDSDTNCCGWLRFLQFY